MSNESKPLTIRDLLDIHPTIGIYYFKRRNTTEPHLEKSLSQALKEFGYELYEEDKEIDGKYNDIVWYLLCKVRKIEDKKLETIEERKKAI